VPSVPTDFVPNPDLSDGPTAEVISPVWKSMTSGGSTGRPKPIDAGKARRSAVRDEVIARAAQSS
jgi:bile acid-coenzyme A ligase